MNCTVHRPAVSRAVARGFAAGSVLVLSTLTTGVASSPVGAVPAANETDRILVAQADSTQPESPASYEPEQADRGEKSFTKYCVECHGEDLRGGLLGGPPLRGLNFEGKYANGSPAGVLFEVMSATMPPDSPGRYSPAVYADLMAYILKRNGFAAGAPLPSDVDALYNLTIEK